MAELVDETKMSLILGDCIDILPAFKKQAQCIIADPPYYKVLEEGWDNAWRTESEYVDWTIAWAKSASLALKFDGIMYVFGQLGKREHVWLKVCAELTNIMQFHDMIIWDRVVGYNDRKDSFTSQYEMILALRHFDCDKPYFNKDAVRIPYSDCTIAKYMKDKRYKDAESRRKHLQKGKKATNILKVPSLKGASKEKVGFPAQKPVKLLNYLINSSSKEGDLIIDPFLGSGSTAVAAKACGRNFVGIEMEPAILAIAQQRLV
jgi:DNA modification methylase